MSSFSHPHKTLGLVSELLKDEYESQVASTLTRSTCQQPESLSKTGITLDEVPISCVPLCPSVKTCHKSNQKEVVCDQKQHVVCELKVSFNLVIINPISFYLMYELLSKMFLAGSCIVSGIQLEIICSFVICNDLIFSCS